MVKHKHNFRETNNSSAGHYGIVLYCTICGEAYSYDSDWRLSSCPRRPHP
jgi:hypothetical protein